MVLRVQEKKGKIIDRGGLLRDGATHAWCRGQKMGAPGAGCSGPRYVPVRNQALAQSPATSVSAARSSEHRGGAAKFLPTVRWAPPPAWELSINQPSTVTRLTAAAGEVHSPPHFFPSGNTRKSEKKNNHRPQGAVPHTSVQGDEMCHVHCPSRSVGRILQTSRRRDAVGLPGGNVA